MLCPNEIYISYVIRPALGLPVPVGPLTLLPAGEFNGKSYYTWFDDNLGYDLFLAWNNIDLRWEIGSGPLETMTVFSYSNFGDTDCPVAGAREAWIGILKLMTDITTELGPRITEPLTEEQICYPILVWEKQCEFAQCVLEYLQILQFSGTAPCEKFDKLKNQRRALEILNCYDVRDIPDNTTNYNFLTYSTIKKLLNY